MKTSSHSFRRLDDFLRIFFIKTKDIDILYLLMGHGTLINYLIYYLGNL